MKSVLQSLQVWKCDKGVFNKDIEGFASSFENLIEHLHIGEARFFRYPPFPDLFVISPRLFVIHLLITGKEIGKRTHIKGALGIILGEQWVDASSSLFCLSGEQSQVAEGFYNLGSIGMLGHTRAEDDRTFF